MRNAIANAAIEAGRDRTVESLHGVVFSERNFRRLAAMSAADAAKSPRDGPRRSAGAHHEIVHPNARTP